MLHLQGAQTASILHVNEHCVQQREDVLAAEEPLEIRLHWEENGKPQRQTVSITMRTPGHDLELAVGFLYTENILQGPHQIRNVQHCGPAASAANVVRVTLQPNVKANVESLKRHFYTSSSCGICGKASLEAVQICSSRPPLQQHFQIKPDLIYSLSNRLAKQQELFLRTGGLHASTLFDLEGNLLCLREDVGRHNALDKLVGASLSQLPLSTNILLLSGRASFELIQKAFMASIPMVAAVGAPSSLAVQLAEQMGITLLGFVREHRFNIYSHSQRIQLAERNKRELS